MRVWYGALHGTSPCSFQSMCAHTFIYIPAARWSPGIAQGLRSSLRLCSNAKGPRLKGGTRGPGLSRGLGSPPRQGRGASLTGTPGEQSRLTPRRAAHPPAQRLPHRGRGSVTTASPQTAPQPGEETTAEYLHPAITAPPPPRPHQVGHRSRYQAPVQASCYSGRLRTLPCPTRGRDPAVATAAGPAQSSPIALSSPPAGLPPQAADVSLHCSLPPPSLASGEPQPQQHNMASSSLRNGAREIEGSYIFMAGAGQGERGWSCDRAAQLPPSFSLCRGTALAGGCCLLSPPSSHLCCGCPAPGSPPPVSASAALLLPLSHFWSRALGDAAPSAAGLPTAAPPSLSPRPSLSRAMAFLH